MSGNEKVLLRLAEAAASGRSDLGTIDRQLKAGQPGVKINVRALLLTLIEIASAMGYLHSMGVVHCGEARIGRAPSQSIPSTRLFCSHVALSSHDPDPKPYSHFSDPGVQHTADMKPANVLLKSSNNDPRGFSVKVSDFGLSRVEDDDTSSSFPFNSCGTAAYVAPEALICNKKVNSSVDVSRRP